MPINLFARYQNLFKKVIFIYRLSVDWLRLQLFRLDFLLCKINNFGGHFSTPVQFAQIVQN